jgi:hypothetical protein
MAGELLEARDLLDRLGADLRAVAQRSTDGAGQQRC